MIDESRHIENDAVKRQALGCAIRVKRKAAGLTLQEVADRTGKSVATVSRIEKGQAIDVAVLLQLGQTIGFSAGALLIEVQSETSKSKVEKTMWNQLKKILT